MTSKQLEKSLWLIQGYYRFLYLWLFLEDIIKKNDLTWFAKDIKISTWSDTSFKLKKDTIKKLLSDIHQNPDKQNFFWYFTQITMFRWICATMKELIDSENNFKRFLKKNLKSQFFHFEHTIKFIRNVLSHNIDTNIHIKRQDYESQKTYLLESGKHIINLNFKYSKYFPKYWTWDKNYWVNVKINFKKIWNNDKFFDIVDLHQLFLISELCYNITVVWKNV